jgi:hypothetical protein
MKKLVFFIASVLFLGTTGCVDPIGLSSGEEMWNPYVEVTLTNWDNEDLHMWISGESIGPHNKLKPDESRKSSYLLLNVPEKGEKDSAFEDITVYAGRNGNVIASKSYSVNNNSIILRVKYDGAFK